MTKARDLANIISGGFTESDIPNLSASKITSGTFADARIADLNASKLTGSIADARIPASAVSQHATSFDDNKIVNDISTLALRQSSNENKSAYNSNSMSVDVFQDATGIASNTNAPHNSSEFVATVSTVTPTVIRNKNNGGVFTQVSGLLPNNNTNWTMEAWGYLPTGSTEESHENHLFSNGSDPYGIVYGTNSGSDRTLRRGIGNGSWQTIGNLAHNTDGTSGAWRHWAVTKNADGVDFFYNGTRYVNNETQSYTYLNNALVFGRGVSASGHNWGGYSTDIRISSSVRYDGSTYTVPTAFHTVDSDTELLIQPNGTNNSTSFVDVSGNNHTVTADSGVIHTTELASPFNLTIANATGNFISNAITAPSSTSKMGAIITYQNAVGTNTLNTDIVLQLSADNGSNFTTATLTAMPDFATGIKMAKVNDLSVTAGTQLKYKISFANQASGSKEARIRGVSLQY